MTTTIAAPTANPFVGPHALAETDSLFGRGVELKTLHDLVIADRIVLLYSPSGAGKTSLLHAGLKRLLVEDGFVVRPTVRVTHELPPALGDLPVRNRYTLSTLLSLEAGRQSELDPATLTTIRLDDYLANTRPTATVDAPECLFFDQFEELFTVDPLDEDAKETFLEEVGHALRDRSRWAVFSMREDFVAQLDPYLKLFPTRLRSRFRLDLLGPEPARQAIQGPAWEVRVEFSAEAASLLVDDLRTVLVQHGGAAVRAKGPTVEPVQLQVVCHRLWTRLGGATMVTPEHVRELGDVDNALRDFYDDVVREVAELTGVSEQALRTWISDELVTEQGYRDQVQHGPAGDTEGRVLPALEDAHLVRADTRRATVWYELAHDRLVDPIRSSNAAWLEEHLSDVQHGARLWDARRRDDRALLVGAQLTCADAWAAQHPNELGDVEREFLEASRKEEARLARERRSARRTRRLAIVATLVSLAAVAGLIAAVWQWRRVDEEKERAERVEQAMTYFFGSEAMTYYFGGGETLFDPLRMQLLLDRMALDAFPDGRSPPAFMLQGINSHLHDSFLANQAFTQPVMSGNGRFIADQTEAGVQIVDLDVSHGELPTEVALIRSDLDVSANLALSGDGSLLAVRPSSGRNIELWDIAREEKSQTLPTPNGETQYWQLEFSPSAGLIAGLRGDAAFGAEAHLDLWDVASGELVTPEPINSLDVVTFDISSTNFLAAASSDLSVHLFDLNTGNELPPLPVEDVGSMMFDEAGARLAVMTFDRDGVDAEVDVYAVPTGELLGSVPIPADAFGWLLGFRSADTILMHVSRVSADVDSGPSDPLESCGLQEWTVTGELLGEVELDCQPVALSDDGERLLTMGDEGWSVWLTADRTTLVTGANPKGTVSVGGFVVARIDGDGRVAVRLLGRGEWFTTLPGGGFQQVVVDGDGDTLVASTADELRVINVETGDVQSRTTLPWQPALLATSDDGRVVAVASSDGQLLRWDARGDREPEGLRHPGEITSLAVTGSGRGVAVASADAITIYTDSGRTTTAHSTQVVDIATDPIGDALAAVVGRPVGISPEPARPALPSEEAELSDETDLLLWDDVDGEPRSIELRSGRPTAVAVTREHVVIASEQGIDVYGRRNLQLAGGFKVGDFLGESPLTVAVAVSDTEHPTVASIAADGTTGFTFHLDAEGIRDDVDAAASNNSWEDLEDRECRQFAGIGCLNH